MREGNTRTVAFWWRQPVRAMAVAIWIATLIALIVARWDTHRPEIAVRWSVGVSDAQRAQLENQFDIAPTGDHESGSRTHRYRLTEWTPSLVTGLLRYDESP